VADDVNAAAAFVQNQVLACDQADTGTTVRTPVWRMPDVAPTPDSDSDRRMSFGVVGGHEFSRDVGDDRAVGCGACASEKAT